MRLPIIPLMLMLLASCNSTSKQPPEDAPTRNESNAPAAPQPLDSSLHNYYRYSSGIEDSLRIVVRDQAAWSELWARIVSNHGPTPAVPRVDFSKDMLIVVALGTRNSGGYSIAITSVNAGPGEVAATVLSSSPGRNCGTTAALTAPMDIVRVSRTDLPVRFIEERAVQDCG